MRKSAKLWILLLLTLPAAPTLHAATLSAAPNRAAFLGVLLLLLFIPVGMLAASLIYAVFDPRRIELGSRLQRQAPLRSFGIGLLTFFIFLLFAIVFAKLRPPKSLSLLVWMPLLFGFVYLLLTGFAMVAHDIGERIQSNLNSRTLGSSFLAVLFGGLTLLGLNFLPLIGQAFFFVVLLVGLGTAVRAMSVRNAAGRPAAPAAG